MTKLTRIESIKCFLQIVLLVFSLCLVNNVFASTYYISTSGNDANACTPDATGASAKRNLSGATGGISCLNEAGGPHTLTIQAGTFTGSGAAYYNLGAKQPNIPAGSTIQGEGASVSIVQPGGGFGILMKNAANNITWKNFTLDCTSMATSTESCFKVTRQDSGITTGWTLSGLKVTECPDNCLFIFHKTSGFLIENNEIKNWGWVTTDANNQGNAIYAEGDTHTVRNNWVYNEVAKGTPESQQCAIRIAPNAGERPSFNSTIEGNFIERVACGIIIGGADLAGDATGNKVFRNVIVDANFIGIMTLFPQTGVKIYNNVIYEKNLACAIGIQIGSNQVNADVENNITHSCTTAVSNSGTGTIQLTNLTADPGFVDPTNGDFSLQSTASTAIDSGTAGLGLTCNGDCDIGAHESLSLATCTVEDGDASTMRISFNNATAPPLTGLTLANWSTRKAGASNAPTAITLTGSNRVDLTLTDAIVGGNAIDFTYTPGTLANTASIGGTANPKSQKAFAFTQQSCTNNVGGGPTGTWDIAAYRIHGLRGTEAAPQVLPYSTAPNSTPGKFVPGARIRIRSAIIRNTADTLNISPSLYCNIDGGAYSAVPDTTFGALNMRTYGTGDTSSDIPANSTATTNLLGAVGAGSFVPALLVRTADAIPAVTIAPTNWTEVERIVEFDTDATVGAVYTCEERDQGGTRLTTTPTVQPTITIVGAQASGGF